MVHAQTPAQKAFSQGIAFFKGQKPNEAIASLEKAIQLNPKYFQAYTQLGYYCVLLNDKISARKYLERSYNLNKNFPSTFYAIGLLYKNQSTNVDSSLFWFAKARAMKMDTSADMKYNVAWAYNANKKYDSAIAILKEAHQLNKQSKTIYREIAFAYVLGKRVTDGIAFFESNIRLDIDVIYYNIAMMALEIDDLEKANKNIEILKGINPKLASIVERRRESKKKIVPQQ